MEELDAVDWRLHIFAMAVLPAACCTYAASPDIALQQSVCLTH